MRPAYEPLTWLHIRSIPAALDTGVRAIIGIKRVGIHVINKAAFEINCPERIAAAVVEDYLNGGLCTLRKNRSAVARSVCMASVAEG
jgi:hypothetical protein